jgi:pimeloyl-ACP methyl ester carboxylesterase
MVMEQKFIDIPGGRLAYIEQNITAANTIFFIHGNSGSSRTWHKQFSSPLLNDYRLIAFDIPGCGQSVLYNNATWDYSPIATGKIIADAIKYLSKESPFALAGFSYGTNIIGEILVHDLSPVGISLAAVCTAGAVYGLDKIFVPGDVIFFHDEPALEDVRNFFTATLISTAEEDILINTEDFYLSKPPFRSALIQSVMQGKLSDEIALVQKQDIPVQVVFGLGDNLLQINYLDTAPFPIWRDTIYKLPGAGHYLQLDQSEAFNQLLAEYMEERFTSVRV